MVCEIQNRSSHFDRKALYLIAIPVSVMLPSVILSGKPVVPVPVVPTPTPSPGSGWLGQLRGLVLRGRDVTLDLRGGLGSRAQHGITPSMGTRGRARISTVGPGLPSDRMLGLQKNSAVIVGLVEMKNK